MKMIFSAITITRYKIERPINSSPVSSITSKRLIVITKVKVD